MKLHPIELGFNRTRRRAAKKIHREVRRALLRCCGVLVERGSDQLSESMFIGGVAVSPLQAKHYLPSLEKWAARLVAGRFQIVAERGAARLLLQRGTKVVTLPPVRTLIDYIGGIIKHWESIVVDGLQNVRSIAGVTLEGQMARVNYRGVWLEYEVASNWAEESLEEVLFWGDLLPNYYYRVGPPYRSGVVLDLGAYQGLFGLAAAIDVGPNGRIFCFEPDERSRNILIINRERNNLRNIQVVPAGVANRTEKRNFISLGTLGSHFGNSNALGTSGTQVYSLPDCCRIAGSSSPAFVKADVEGAELEMVEPCLDWLRKLRSTVFSVASYHIVDCAPTRIRLEHAFREAGYQTDTTRKGHQTTVAWRS